MAYKVYDIRYRSTALAVCKPHLATLEFRKQRGGWMCVGRATAGTTVLNRKSLAGKLRHAWAVAGARKRDITQLRALKAYGWGLVSWTPLPEKSLLSQFARLAKTCEQAGGNSETIRFRGLGLLSATRNHRPSRLLAWDQSGKTRFS